MTDLNLATTQKRIWSFVIDDLVISMLFIAIFYEQLGTITTAEGITFFIKNNYWMLIALKVVYHTLFTWQNGQTLGKYIMKIRVVSIEGQYILSLPISFLRSAMRVLGEMFFYIGFLPAFFSPTKQTLHDRVARSIVVNA